MIRGHCGPTVRPVSLHRRKPKLPLRGVAKLRAILDKAGQVPPHMKETTVAFKDGNDLKLRDKDGRLFSRRAALAGAAGALALAGTELMGCSAFGVSANDASTASNELTLSLIHI